MTRKWDSTLDQMDAEEAEAKRRIRVDRISAEERNAEHVARYDARTLPYDIIAGRGGYRVSVDGKQVAYLYYHGGWGRGSWRVSSLHLRRRDGQAPKERWAYGKEPAQLSHWLRSYDADGADYPTEDQLAEHKRQRDARIAAAEQERVRRRAEADAEHDRRREAARSAMEGLHEIAATPLNNFQRHAIAFAIEEVRKIAGAG